MYSKGAINCPCVTNPQFAVNIQCILFIRTPRVLKSHKHFSLLKSQCLIKKIFHVLALALSWLKKNTTTTATKLSRFNKPLMCQTLFMRIYSIHNYACHTPSKRHTTSTSRFTHCRLSPVQRDDVSLSLQKRYYSTLLLLWENSFSISKNVS